MLHGRNKSQTDTVLCEPVFKKIMHSLQIVNRLLLGRNLGVGGVGEMKGRLLLYNLGLLKNVTTSTSSAVTNEDIC